MSLQTYFSIDKQNKYVLKYNCICLTRQIYKNLNKGDIYYER